MRRALLLYNPAAGRFPVKTFVPDVVSPLQAAGWRVELAETLSGAHATSIARQAAAEKFDFSLLEAAQDLGARRWQSLLHIFLPGIKRGVWTAILVVFIPSLGSYVIPDLVGGPSGEMIGNKIAQRVFVDRNLPHASALSVLLILAVLLPLLAVLILQSKKGRAAPIIEEDA